VSQEEYTRMLQAAYRAVKVQERIIKRYQDLFKRAGLYHGEVDGMADDELGLVYGKFVGSKDFADFWEVVSWEVRKEISE
jgi:hypothetical protein